MLFRSNDTAVGNISITVSSADVIVKSVNNAKLTGNVTISGALTSVTIQGMDITVNASMKYSADRVAAVRYTASSGSPKIVLAGNTFTFDPDVKAAGLKSYVFTGEGKTIATGSTFSNNIIIGVTGHALVFKGVADGGTVTVSGNTVTMNPDEDIAAPSDSDASGTGRALLKVWHSSTPSNGVTYIVKDNTVSITSGNTYKTNVVRVDATADDAAGKIKVFMTNNRYEGAVASPYLYGGSLSS